MNKKILSIIVLILLSGPLFSKGYKIDVTITGASNDTLLLAYYHGDGRYVKDTAYIDAKGHAVFSKETPLPGGLYLLAKNGMQLFDFLISDDDSQTFSIITRDDDLYNSLKFQNSPENTRYREVQTYMGERQRASARLREKAQADNAFESVAKDSLIIINDEVLAYTDKVAKEFPGKLVASLVKAMRGAPLIPEINIAEGTPGRDSLMWVHAYQFNKIHYFDNIDFSDSRLLNTPVLQPNLDYYFSKALLQVPDSIIPQVKRILDRSKANSDVFMFCTGHLFNMYVKSPIMGMESVVVFIGENYYLTGQAPWADKEFLKQVSDFVEYNKHSLIGLQAHEMRMQTAEGKTVSLYGLKDSYVILFFYEPNCSHCQKEAPKLLELYHKYKDVGVNCFAVCIQNNKEEWEKFVADGKYDWINVWDPTRQSRFPEYYNVSTTPQIYLLDKDKRIIGRRLDSENLDIILKNVLNRK